MSKVTVVGAGAVGATCANVMACREVASEVVLIDIKEAGSFNQNVLKLLLEKADRNDRFYVIGQVGYRALRKDPRLVQEFQYGATCLLYTSRCV